MTSSHPFQETASDSSWWDLVSRHLGGILRPEGSHNNRVALTFDDGPHPVYTSQILDILRRHGVLASFFPLGLHAEQHPDIIRRIFEGGHDIGNHTYGHRHLLLAPRKVIRQELTRSSRVIEQITGQRPRFFRPPRGLVGYRAVREARQLGMDTILWTLSPRDWTRPGTRRIAHRVLSKSRGGSIVLLHDAKYDDLQEDRSQTVDALPPIIDGLRDRGYHLVSLTDLVAAPQGRKEDPS